MKTLESIFSRTAQFGLLIYLTGCFGLLIVLASAHFSARTIHKLIQLGRLITTMGLPFLFTEKGEKI